MGCAHKEGKRGKLHILWKKKKARIRTKSGPVSFCHKGSWCRRWERDGVYIFKGEMRRSSKSCMQELLIHVGSPLPPAKKKKKKSSQCFPERKTSPWKSRIQKLTNQTFWRLVLSEKAEVRVSGENHMAIFLSHGNTFDMGCDNLEGCETSPKDGKGGPEVDKYFCNWISLTWLGSYAPITGKALSGKTYPTSLSTNPMRTSEQLRPLLARRNPSFF